MTSIHDLRIAIIGSKPPIWRRVAVPSDINLGILHQIIQIVMGWQEDHLHHFIFKDKSLLRSREEIDRLYRQHRWEEASIASHGERIFVPTTTPFGDPLDMEGEDEDEVRLIDVCPNVKDKLIYEYDFGDSWQHSIAVQKVYEAKPDVTYPICLTGKRAGPVEDCGGIWGYADLIDALNDPTHPNHEELIEMYGGPIDSEAFDLDDINGRLSTWWKDYQKWLKKQRK